MGAGAILIARYELYAPQQNGADTHHHSAARWISSIRCNWFGDCSWISAVTMRESLIDGMLGQVLYGYIPPQSAEPEPSAENQARAQAILECCYQDFEQQTFLTPLTDAGQSWSSGEPPPDALVAMAEGENPQALWELGYLLATGQSGVPTPENDQQAFEYIVRAAELGHPIALAEAGAAFRFGYFDQDIDIPRAREYLRAASDQGEVVAMLTLATLPPQDGQPLEDYAVEKLELELQSATECYRDAAIMVSRRLIEGQRGLEQDQDLAEMILRRVSDRDLDV
jgi:hypothetical protein